MNPMDITAVGFPAVIVELVLIGFNKVFVIKRSVTPFYTPFDEITRQTEVEFHEEQIILAEDEDQGDDKNKKSRMKFPNEKLLKSHSCLKTLMIIKV